MKIRLSLSLGVAALALAPISSFAAPDDEDIIIVTGSPIAKTVGDMVVGVSSVEGAELARKSAESLGDALRDEPGVSSTFFGAGASRPIIRGQGGDRIRILDNGIGVVDASGASPDHATAVTPAMAQKIEIVRGTGLLRYGSSAAGGVINVIDGRLPTEVPEDGLEGAVRVGASTVDDGQEAAGGVTASLGALGGVDIVGHLSATWRDADDYDIPGFAESAQLRAMQSPSVANSGPRDTLINSYAETKSLSGGIGFIGERGFLAIGAKDAGSTYGIPGGEEAEDGVFIDLDQTRYDLNGQLRFDGPFEALNLYAGTANYKHVEFEGPGEPGTRFTNEGWEARIELVQAPRGNWRAAYGLQTRDNEFAAIGDEAFVPPTDTSQWGIYTFQEYDVANWTLEGAIRFEQTDQKNATDGVNRSFDGVSVSIGGITEFGDGFSFGTTLSRTERAPTTAELFANGPHLATGQFERGNLALDEEVGTGIETTLRWDGADGHIAANVFYTDYDGYIYERETGEIEDGLPVFEFTPNDATFRGIELESEYALGTVGRFDVRTDLAADFVRAKLDISGNDNLPRIPSVSVTAGLDGETDHVTLRGEVEYAAKQDDVAQFELPTDSYTLVNLYATWRPYGVDSPIEFDAGLHNAFDEEAREHTSFLKELVPLPGRNLRISARYQF